MKKILGILTALALVTGVAAAGRAPRNTINVIVPYKLQGQWVFDDAARGLRQEAFVAGADDWIDKASARIPNAARGFVLVFSAEPFPGHQFVMDRRRLEGGGAWYFSPTFNMEGWLCSSLMKYFSAPPAKIYAQVKPKGA